MLYQVLFGMNGKFKRNCWLSKNGRPAFFEWYHNIECQTQSLTPYQWSWTLSKLLVHYTLPELIVHGTFQYEAKPTQTSLPHIALGITGVSNCGMQPLMRRLHVTLPELRQKITSALR